MRNLIVVVIVFLLATVGVIAEPAGTPASAPATSTAPASKPADPKTASLAEALGDFILLLEKNDKDTALSRWAGSKRSQDDVNKDWDAMCKAHAKYDYRKWIEKAAAAAEKFTLGGHSADHLHVIWVKTNEGWRIDSTMHCR